MKCSRCKGLVISDTFLCETSYWMEGFRCVNCGWVRLNKEVKEYASQTKDNRVNKLDELELYRTRSRGVKRSSHSIQH